MSESRASLRDILILTAVTLLLAALSIDKPFSIDDPLFVWLGRHLAQHPADFFGFSVNWYGAEAPMHEITQNPPLDGYYIALAGSLFGWTERALHASFILPALLLVLGVYALSVRLCAHPLASTLLVIATPAFLVSSSSVMCDVPMLALWCWAIVFWIRGFDQGSWPCFATAAIAASLAYATKYFAISLVPLLLLYGFARTRRAGWWLAWSLLPLVTAIGFELAANRLYGHGLFSQASGYAYSSRGRSDAGRIAQAIIGVLFVGGCLVHGIFFSAYLVPRKLFLVLLGAAVLGAAFVSMSSWEFLGAKGAPLSAPIGVALLVLFLLGGMSLIAIVVRVLAEGFSPDTLLLAAWFGGTFAFATFVNWADNARSNLPLAPAAGILIMRTLARQPTARVPTSRLPTTRHPGASLGLWKRFTLCFVPGALLSSAVAYGDYRWAVGVRDASQYVMKNLAGLKRKVYFQGHWGFQYYMEESGGVAMRLTDDVLEVGDLLVLPSNNAGVHAPPRSVTALIEDHVVADPSWIRTMSSADAAGFYASNFGPLPFVLGPITPDLYRMLEVRHRFSYASKEDKGRGEERLIPK